MSDTSFSERGHEWPRPYTPEELKAIANSIDLEKLSPNTVERLQQVVEGYQWATSSDKGGLFHRANKELRQQLKEILKLIGKGVPREAIEVELKQLDAPTYQRLGSFNLADPTSIKSAAETVLSKIPTSGPDPKRARLQYIGDELIGIYRTATGEDPGRRVRVTEYEEKVSLDTRDREYGPFVSFVRAALAPFGAERGCEADIKTAIKRYKASSSEC